MTDAVALPFPLAKPAPLDHVASVVAKYFCVPVCLISLVSGRKVLVAGSWGLLSDQMPTDLAFCKIVAAREAIVVVSDALNEPQFKKIVSVSDTPRFRFLAGLPLIAPSGDCLGTLCIADYKPNNLSYGQIVILKHMANVAVDELLRKGDHS